LVGFGDGVEVNKRGGNGKGHGYPFESCMSDCQSDLQKLLGCIFMLKILSEEGFVGTRKE
jgi:hypothetical protein